MCVNPRKIKNNSLDFSAKHDKSYFYVPCGCCHECTDARSRSYEVRCIAEYLYTSHYCYFFTLTFNEDNLPMVSLDDDYPIPCFDKSLVQKFFKRLRSRLDIPIKYFLTSEYGGLSGRPHHHLLIFSQSPIYDILDLVTISWQYGFVYPRIDKSTYDDCVVRSVDAISYCCKYVTKGTDIPDVPQAYKDVYGDLFYPFHLQSIGLGIALKDICNDDNYIHNRVDIVTDKGLSSYSIPLYIQRKVLYNTSINKHGNVQYKLNDYGVNINVKRLSYLLEDTFDNLSFVQNHAIELNKDNVISHDDLKLFLSLSKSDLFDLAKYSVFYCGTENLSYLFYQDIKQDFLNYIEKSTNHWLSVHSSKKKYITFGFDKLLAIYHKLLVVLRYNNYLINYSNNLIFKYFYYGKNYKKEKYKPLNMEDFVFGKRIYH